MARRTPPPIEQVLGSGRFARARAREERRPLLIDFRRRRLEEHALGWTPNRDFNAWLRGGVGRLALVQTKFADAERWYDQTQRGREADGLLDEASAEP
jgi:hypothetical protein